jgi:hypothetical protein
VETKTKLSANEKTFIHYVLKHYANNTEGLEQDDVYEIYDMAEKVKSL